MREFYANYNIVSFPMGNTGAQMGGWYRKEIKTVADRRASSSGRGFAGKVIERMGGLRKTFLAAKLPGAEGHAGRRRVGGPYDDQKLGFFKVAPFYHYPGWWEGGPQLDLYINNKAYDSLSAENKAIVEAAASTGRQAKYDARNPEALKQLVANKTKLVAPRPGRPGPGVHGPVRRDRCQEPGWKKVYEDYANFRREANLWFRFTEARFDNYMQGQAVSTAFGSAPSPASAGLFMCSVLLTRSRH